MIKDILFVIEGSNKNKVRTLETRLKEFSKNSSICILHKKSDVRPWNLDLSTNTDKKYVCLLNEDMKIEDNFLEIFEEYNEQLNVIYLPLVLLENAKSQGVLNNCIWNPNLSVDVGYLDHDLALKQIDTTLYGSLIPIKDFSNKEYYNENIELYQHFYFLNKYTSITENIVVGIPKILFSTSIDLSFEHIENEIKIGRAHV